MATGIEWTEETWNPVTGCSKVSPGCAHCYAETLSLRFGRSVGPWTPANAAENVVLHPERLEQPLRRRKATMFFVNSMSDLFHELVPFEYLARVFDVMASEPGERHVFQILTKRPERARDFFEWLWTEEAWPHLGDAIRAAGEAWPRPHIWLGVSIENARFTWRADALRQIPAAVRFISAEPLIGSLQPKRAGERWPAVDGRRQLDLTAIDWLIAGGESGHRARPMQAQWARELRDACQGNGTAFFFKQWGGRTPKAGGRLLDGETWDEMPRANAA
jgi:protein gp37